MSQLRSRPSIAESGPIAIRRTLDLGRYRPKIVYAEAPSGGDTPIHELTL